VRSRIFRDMRSAPRDGGSVEVKHGPQQEIVLARWSGQSRSWIAVHDPLRKTLNGVTGWRPAPTK
jgi:hypothetical protein